MRSGAPALSGPAAGLLTKHHVSKRSLATGFGLQRLALHGSMVQRRWTASSAASAKDAQATLISYTVQKGETLWDVAVQHGVSMRTIKDLNKLSGNEPALSEGKQLLVPASGITAVAAVDSSTSAAALGNLPARGLWVGSEHVRLATIGEAKQLYLRQCDRGNSQNTLLVLYAPWCPHCRDMEDELERLAEGLSHVPSVRVVAVNCDSVEGRIFAREVLGVAYYPSIISFPEHSRTFFKYKGRQRDAESLLRFLNMTCCAREDKMWTLRPTGGRAAQGGPLQLLSSISPVGTSPSAMAAALALAVAGLGAAAVVLARRRQAEAAATAAAAAGAPDGAVVDPDVVAELDSSLGRMAQLMVRAIATRVFLMFRGPVGPAPQAAALAADAGAGNAALAAGPAARLGGLRPPQEVEVEVEVLAAGVGARGGTSWGPSPLDGTRVLAGPPGPVAVGSAVGAVGAPPVVAAATVGLDAALAPGGGAAYTPGLSSSSSPSAFAMEDPSQYGNGNGAMSPARELTSEERMRLTRLTDDELIALVNSDPDLDKVLSRLLGDK